MSILQGANMGQVASSGYRGTAAGSSTPTGSGSSSYTPSGDPHYDALQQEHALTTGEQTWDQALAVGESDAFQYTAMAASVVGPAAWAGGTALAGGATVGGASLAAGTAALPLAVAAGAGFLGGMAGSWLGDKAGHWFMQTDFMRNQGYVPIYGPGEMPARFDHDVAHVNSGLSLGAMIGGVVLGAVAAVAVGALVVATGGAALLVIAAGAAAGGLVGGMGFGFASAVGQYGTNKGKIAQGSPNVYFENQPVARVGDKVACQEHAVSAVAEGAETVWANNMPIARIGHKTTCDGTINDGIDSIAIDMKTSAKSLPIDVGLASRLVRTGLVLLDILPFPRGRPRRGDPSTPHGGNTPNSCRTTCGDPIDVASGQFVDLRTDLFIPGTIALRLNRCHAPGASGVQGLDWSGTWAQHLRLDRETVTFQNPEGSLIVFHTPSDDVASHNLRFPHLELLGRRSADLFVYDRPSQLFYVFADEGTDIRRLSRIEDRNGNTIAFHYDGNGLARVVHSDGFAVQVHSEGGLIRHASLQAGDADGCDCFWDYSDAGRLHEVRSAQTGTMRYDLDGHGRITGWHDTKDTHVHYEYDNDSRIIRTWTDSGHMAGRIDYDLSQQRTVFTNPQGESSVFDWDEDGLVWRETDPLGHVWQTEWDRAFHVTARIDPLGNRSEFTYDSLGNLTRHVNADGVAATFGYDANGRPAFSADALGNRTEFRHDAHGNLVGVTDALGRVTTMGLGRKGEVLRIDMPGDVQERIYYDPIMRPSRRRDPDGNETRTGYDTEGRLRWFTDQIGATTRYEMDRGPENPRGALRRVETPDGATSVLSWDNEGQLHAITDPNGTTRHFRFGAFDLPMETVDAQGHRLRLEHDSLLRLSAVINELGERYEFTYDAAGNTVAERDYSGRVTRYAHDAAGRVVQKTAADGVRTHYTYAPTGLLLAQQIDGGAKTVFAFDARGLMIRAENDAAVVEYDYDALGRIVAERLNGRQITSEYSVSGQRIGRSGDVLHLTAEWTRAGLPAELGIGQHAPLSFQHDPRGLEQLRASPSGFALAQGHTVMGQLAEQMAGPLARLPEEARTGGLGRGMPVETAMRSGARTHRSYDWDRLGRAIAVNDRVMGLVRLDYDQRGQVTTTRRDAPDGSSALSHFEYDPTRNIAAVIQAGRAEKVQSSAGRVKRRGTVSYRHDDCGRVIEKRVEEPGFRPRVWRMVWDGQDQLSAVETPDGSRWSYRYDPMGRRVARLSGDRGHAYQWEGDSVIAEAPMTADGTVAWDAARHWVYEPGTFRPLAQIEGDALHYIVTDHLGTPRELFSEDGADVAWRAELGLWGELSDLRLPQPANDNAPPTDCPIRFQGQWEDAETGLHYNRFRYYDPAAMQYLSPDPIGLAGGSRPQGYVADPNGWVDPLGLAGCGGAVPQYGTPFQPLTPAQKAAIQARVNSRTATRNDYNHLQWDRRFNNRRNRGVNRFWSQERATLRSGGTGTRNWAPTQRADILAGRRPTFGGETLEGHHMHNALDHPHIADNPGNIYPATRHEHFERWHGGNWQNDTYGTPNNPSYPEDF